jgi:hypothetical protein
MIREREFDKEHERIDRERERRKREIDLQWAQMVEEGKRVQKLWEDVLERWK